MTCLINGVTLCKHITHTSLYIYDAIALIFILLFFFFVEPNTFVGVSIGVGLSVSVFLLIVIIVAVACLVWYGRQKGWDNTNSLHKIVETCMWRLAKLLFKNVLFLT